MSRKSGNRFCEKRTCVNKKLGWADDVKIKSSRPKRSYCPGGGRKITSCFAESAITSGGDCSFILWMAQNRS